MRSQITINNILFVAFSETGGGGQGKDRRAERHRRHSLTRIRCGARNASSYPGRSLSGKVNTFVTVTLISLINMPRDSVAVFTEGGGGYFHSGILQDCTIAAAVAYPTSAGTLNTAGKSVSLCQSLDQSNFIYKKLNFVYREATSPEEATQSAAGHMKTINNKQFTHYHAHKHSQN